MKFLLALLAILCGIALVISLDTGSLDTAQVAGVAIILLGVAVIVEGGPLFTINRQ